MIPEARSEKCDSASTFLSVNFSPRNCPKTVPKIVPKIVQKIDPKIIQKNKYLKQGLHVIVRQNFSQFIGLIDVWFIIKKVDNVQNIFELLASISWGISENINKYIIINMSQKLLRTVLK